MLRQAQHERFLPRVVSTAPFTLSLSKPVLSLSKGVHGSVCSGLCANRKNQLMHLVVFSCKVASRLLGYLGFTSDTCRLCGAVAQLGER
jgi:hypothetical protein